MEAVIPIPTGEKLNKLKINAFSWTDQRIEASGQIDTMNLEREANTEKYSQVQLPWSRSYWSHKQQEALK